MRLDESYRMAAQVQREYDDGVITLEEYQELLDWLAKYLTNLD